MPVTVQVDLTDLDQFAQGFPHHLFAEHRREAPVWWHEPTEHTPDGEGFWSVATHAETLAVLRDPATYSSERGGARRHGGTLLQDMEVAGVVLNMMDDPRHARIRRLVSTGLTPRMVGLLEDDLRRRTRTLFDGVNDGVPFDFLVEIAAELPLQAICGLLGVPDDDRHELCAIADTTFDVRAESSDARDRPRPGSLLDYGARLVAAKRARPTDDMLSVVVHAELADVEPPRLSDAELCVFFSLLFAAGAETTRNAIAGGVLALVEHPDQLAALASDRSLLPAAIEEILRWTTPSPSKRRTVTCPTTLRDHALAPGDKVLVWEASANRDELVFDRADQFDVGRDPNPHVAFGHGAHFCLGANLAKLELRIVLDELLSTFQRIELAGPVEWTRSNRHTGIRHLVVACDRRRVTIAP